MGEISSMDTIFQVDIGLSGQITHRLKEDPKGSGELSG